MKNMNRNMALRVFIIVSVLVGIIILGGCSTAQNPPKNDMKSENGQVGILPEQLPNVGGQKLNTQNMTGNSTDFERAQKIANQIEKYQSVDKASVIVNGNQAIVGLKLNNNLQNENVTSKLQNEIMGNKMGNQLDNGLNDSNILGNKNVNPNNITRNTDLNKLVSDKVKELDTNITQVLVTTDNGILNKIDNLNNTIKTEMGNIVDSIK